MINQLKTIALALPIVCLMACDEAPRMSDADIEKMALADAAKEASRDSLLNTLMSNEPAVKDFTITTARVLYVAVVDDGTPRDGYAQYMCSVVKDNKLPADKVKVIRVNSSKDPKSDNAYGVLLGECQCN